MYHLLHSQVHERHMLTYCQYIVAAGNLQDTGLELAHYDSHASAAGLWLDEINDFKTCQVTLLNKMHVNLESTYRSFKVTATERDIEHLFEDSAFRTEAIAIMRRESVSRLKSQDPDMWPRYGMRFRDYIRLKKDMKVVEDLFEELQVGKKPMHANDWEISPKGDSILDFPNTGTDIPPLKFRVLSHVLVEFSPLFAQMFAADVSEVAIDPEMINDLPKESYRKTLKDGSEVTVYRMPQVEANEHEALTTLLHAAHLHNDKVPQKLEFNAFVSIAEVCLRYRCTSPVEWAVESRWLSHWQDAIGDQMREDHLLFISYVFNLEEVFTRTSKEVILHLEDEDELQEKTLWPKEVREKIKAMRTAKMSQIQQCCNGVIQGYLRSGHTGSHHSIGIGPLQPSSTPRCPKRSHTCDAQNLGWAMMIFNELGTLPNIAGNSAYQTLACQPGRSLQSVVKELQKISSTPNLHSEVCDFTMSFRSVIRDLYSSIQGLTLDEVKRRKKSRAAPSSPPHVHELPVLSLSPANCSLSTDDGRSSSFSLASGHGPSTDENSTHSLSHAQTFTFRDPSDRRGSIATSNSNNSGDSDLPPFGSSVSPLTHTPNNDGLPLSKKELDHILFSKPSNNNSEGRVRSNPGVLWYPGSTNEKFHPDTRQGFKEMLPVTEAKYLREEQDRDLLTRPVGI